MHLENPAEWRTSLAGCDVPIEVVAAARGVGSFLIIDFRPVRQSEAPSRVQRVGLWIYLCDWQLWDGDAQVLDSDEEADDKYRTALAPLVGQRLVRWGVDHDRQSCEFEFDRGMSLVADDADDLYGENARLFQVSVDGAHAFSFVSASGITN